MDLKMNMNKIKVILNNYILDHEIKVVEVIECVHENIYLGQKISPCSDSDYEK